MNTTTNVENKAVETAQTLLDQASTSARQLTDTATQEAARVGDLVRDWVGRQSDQARTAAATVRDEALAAKQRTERYVSDQPMKSVLIAAAAGALITGLVMLATSRRRGD
jgi:ElaB/YqjD/DUF883 family membrane-anchored ribosome-binding protein